MNVNENENEDEDETLTRLLKAARAPYDCAVRFHLSRAEILALVRGLLVAHGPGLTPAELRELAGAAGVPVSVLVRVARGGEPAPVVRPISRWATRTRLARGAW